MTSLSEMLDIVANREASRKLRHRNFVAAFKSVNAPAPLSPLLRVFSRIKWLLAVFRDIKA